MQCTQWKGGKVCDAVGPCLKYKDTPVFPAAPGPVIIAPHGKSKPAGQVMPPAVKPAKPQTAQPARQVIMPRKTKPVAGQVMPPTTKPAPQVMPPTTATASGVSPVAKAAKLGASGLPAGAVPPVPPNSTLGKVMQKATEDVFNLLGGSHAEAAYQLSTE